MVSFLAGDLTLVLLFSISMTLPPPPPSIVVWRPPLVGSYKINTDRYIKDGFVSGAGIIRDHIGYCFRAFSAFYGPCLILEAELITILDGILLARGIRLSAIWVEADLTLAIHYIIRDEGPSNIQGTLR